MVIWLTEQQARAIAQHGLSEVPREACGLIAGRGGQVNAVIPLPNSAADPQHHYQADHTAFVRAMFDLERRGETLIGIYHSHPNGDPIPSQIDIAQAAYPDAAYVIVGLRSGKPRLAAWRIQPHEVERIPLHIGALPPAVQPGKLPDSHKIAILISVILAFMIMIVVSLSLLPPAPKIP